MTSSVLRLFKDPVYSYETRLGVDQYKLEFTLSYRQQIYHINFYDSANNPVQSGIPLIEGVVTQIGDGFILLVPIEPRKFEDTHPTEL